MTTTHIPISVGQAKRVLEWWSSSEKFRQMVAVDTAQAAREFPVDIDPELVRALWDPFYAIQAGRDETELHPVVHEYREFFRGKTIWRGEVKDECSPSEPRFQAWRSRQIKRNVLENGGYDDYIIHTPIAIELTEGCSVGCWFCGVGATKMFESWRYTPENAKLWRELLAVLYDKIGPATKWGFCYWATDPLDNPDYEHFATDFATITGIFPQTTTAQAQKHVERLKKLLPLSNSLGCRVNRFSVLTEPLLRQIHAAFTADELLNVEIVSQMPGGTVAKANAGLFREKAKERKKVVEIEEKKLVELAETQRRIAAATESDVTIMTPAQPGTIACVSGFLLNMVHRTIKLISPCRANDRWPLGYIVFDEATFTDAQNLSEIVETMMDTHMRIGLDIEDPVRLNPGLEYEQVDDGFHVKSPMTALTFKREDLAEYLHSLGRQVSSGQKTAGEIALTNFFQHGIPEANTIGTLDLMFDHGLLMDRHGLTGMEPLQA